MIRRVVLGFWTRCLVCRQMYEMAQEMPDDAKLKQDFGAQVRKQIADLTCKCGCRDFGPLMQQEHTAPDPYVTPP